MNTRYAFIRFPHYCHQLSKRRHQDPLLVLVKESRKALYVSDIGTEEYRLGIRIGMPLAHAKAIAPQIVHRTHHDDDDTTLFATLAQHAFYFSPHVSVVDFGLLLNITGCAHLFGNEAGMFTAMSDFFRTHGFDTTIAIAPYPALAQALAQYAPGTITTGDHAALIKALPIAALSAGDDTVAALKQLAIITIGDLLKLPRMMLSKRFGLPFLHKLDQLLGVIREPPTYISESLRFLYQEHYVSPLRGHSELLIASSNLLAQALKNLSAHHLALHRVSFGYTDIFKHHVDIEVETSKPHNSLDAWLALLTLKTEQLRIKQGIDTLTVHATHYVRAVAHTRMLTQRNDAVAEGDIATTCDTLKSRLGTHAVFQLRIIDHHVPEHAVTKDQSLMLPRHQKLPPRPVRLLKKPVPISAIALVPDNPPAKIMWNDRCITILHASGPERIETPWWTENQESPRDYYIVEDERGKRLWIYATGMPKQWFVHGVFV